MPDKIEATVRCPLCGEYVHGVVNKLTRSDILMGHIVKDHVGLIRPNLPHEGPPLPRSWGIKWPWKK